MSMHWFDYVMVGAFFIVMLIIGFKSKKSVHDSNDFFVAGGRVPWWLSGISHHVSGYSGVVFVGYAGIAYTHGISIYFWWALNIAIAMSIGAVIMAPRWPKLRKSLGIQSPTEYLEMRYNTSTQVIVAISGVIVKLLDVGAKWASMGILLYGFTGIPIWVGIVVSSLVSLVYIAIGGLIADLWTDFAQFVVQIVAGLALFIGVVSRLDDFGFTITSAFNALPEANLRLMNEGRGQGSLSWTLLYFFVIFFSYNGGTWNLAARFISTPNQKEAKKSAFLSAALYLVWPIILFFPMWVGPLIFPGLTQGEAEATLYSSLTNEFLPVGLIGLVLASMFANTLSMCTSDANTISAVLTRDIIPKFKPEIKSLDAKASLFYARATTIGFTSLTILVALLRDYMGGVTGLILTWFAALLGPTAIPLLFGLLPIYKYADSKAAIVSMLGGFGVFILTQLGIQFEADVALIAPLATSFVLFTGITLINKYVLKIEIKPEITDLLDELSDEEMSA
ncbi:sodium:solute symporter family protein [Proteiniclasticum aestuarii]|nr:sodium:solute symporter family protein [Proteiniclasticum aestuarii]